MVTTAPWDAKAYKKAVLIPWSQIAARRESLEAAARELQDNQNARKFLALDLRELFAIPSDHVTADQLDYISGELDKAFNKNMRYPAAAALSSLKSSLVAQHRFMDPNFWAEAAAAQEAGKHEELLSAVRDVAREAPLQVLSRGLAEQRISALVTGELASSEVERLLSEEGVRVYEEFELPDEKEFSVVRNSWTGVRKFSDFRSMADILTLANGRPRVTTFIDVLQVDGQMVGPALVTESLMKARSAADTDAVQAAQKFLAEASRVEDADQLRRLVILSVVQRINELRANEMPLRRIAERLTAAGLDEFDVCRLIAETVRSSKATRKLNLDDVRAALADGRLEEARRSLESLPDNKEETEDRDDLKELIHRRETEKSDALSEYESAVRGDDFERAESWLRKAMVADTADDELQAKLTRLPPPAPRLAAAAEGEAIRLSWTDPGTEVRYLLFRGRIPVGQFPSSEPLVDGLSERTFLDCSAPVGEQLHYGVVAERSTGIRSAAGQASAIALPAPSQVSTRSFSSAVEVSWALHPRAQCVSVQLRSPDGTVKTQEVRNASSCRFESLEQGLTFSINLSAEYLTSAGVQRSTTTSCHATTRPDPHPISDLTLAPSGEVNGTSELVATWTGIPGFTTELWSLGQDLKLVAGGVTTEKDLREIGGVRLASHVVEVRDGTTFARVTGIDGVQQIVALLQTDAGLLVGHPKSYGVVPKFANVKVQDKADGVQLSWDWPDGDYLAEVTWTIAGTSRSRRVTWARYRTAGLVMLSGNPSNIENISICAVGKSGQDEWYSPPVEVYRNAALKPSIAYHVRIQRPLLGRARATITCELLSGDDKEVSVGVFLRTGDVVPIRPNDAERLSVLSLDFSADSVQVATIDLGKPRGAFVLKVFPMDSRIQIRHPLPQELKG